MLQLICMAKQTKAKVPESWLTVVAFDPGGTTGWCVMCVDGHAFDQPELNLEKRLLHWAAGQIVGDFDSQLDEIISLTEFWDFAAIVTESFQLRKFTRGAELLVPVEVNAVLSYFCRSVSRELFKQSPSLGKSTMTDERLREAKLWTPGSDHARDATRHAMTFLRRCRSDKKLRARAWPHVEAIKNA